MQRSHTLQGICAYRILPSCNLKQVSETRLAGAIVHDAKGKVVNPRGPFGENPLAATLVGGGGSRNVLAARSRPSCRRIEPWPDQPGRDKGQTISGPTPGDRPSRRGWKGS